MSTVARARQAAGFAANLYWQRAQVSYRAHVKRDELARLWTRAGRGDPYALYDRLRSRGSMTPTALGNWSSASHEICSRVLRDRRFGVRPLDGDPADEAMNLSFLEMDPPDHTRLRRLVAPAFSPKQMTAWGPRIDKRVQQLLDDAGERFDLVDALAAPLPIAVISELLGVPQDRGADFRRYGATIGTALDGIRSLRHASALMAANTELERLFTDLFELRRREPADDVVSMVVAAEGDQVAPAELLPLCVLLLVAGFETTVNLISNTVLALLEHPDQWALLREDPSLAAAAVEETLRYDPPVQQTGRVAHEPLDLDGHAVRRGQFVAILIGGANRDPAVHPDPNRFDITRRQHDNLAFSSGIHYCVGQPLAKLEAVTAVRAVAERWPGLALAGPVKRRRGTTIRGPLHLPVRV
jgi:P450-derived glycosyltransferase activator